MRSYDHKKIDKKWQKEWDKNKLYRAREKGKKMYVLDMFPYPSGDGLHVGHPKGYIATDIVSRHARMQGKSVLHPMGWDAFGLPAENYAIKNKVHPRKAVEKNVKRFKEQLKLIGLDYDWSREINTTDPEFYKWTQWIFLKLFEKGLAYQSFEPINWCPSCQTGLANEDLEGNACERCGTIVEKRPMRQWILKITAYAERLLQDLELLPDWQEHIKESQRNWIGKSEGAEIDFPLELGKKYTFVIFHGFQGSPDMPRWQWVKRGLEEMGHRVIIPRLPHTEHPIEEEQVQAGLEAANYDENTVIVGHSLGAVVALKVLERLPHPVARLVTIGGFVDRKFKDEPRSFEDNWKWAFDGAKIRSNAKSVTVLHDPRDYAISDAQSKALADLLGTTVTIGTSSKPHFTGEKEPDVLMWLRPTIRVFTTRPDTLFGATYMVLSPEHPWVQLALRDDHKGVLKNQPEVHAYVAKAAAKTEIERQENKEKTGVKLEGVLAINPATGEKIPLYVADYVLANYGTGAIMAVPAHDERDYEFAKKFDIPIRQVVAPETGTKRDNEERRDGGCAVIFDPNTQKYAVAKNPSGIYGLFAGGINEGESFRDGILREVREESGLHAFKHVEEIGATFSHFHNPRKNVNRFCLAKCMLVILADAETHNVQLEAHENFTLHWTDAADILDNWKRLDTDKNRDHWDQFMREAVARTIELGYDTTSDPRVYKRTPHVGDGRLVNSGEFDEMPTDEARGAIAERFGTKKTTYKIRDWVFSRQRYWGEPIPIIHCGKCGIVPVPYRDLPVKLPDVKHYEPTGTGESPLAAITKWVNTRCPNCHGRARRETNTMPQWAGSSWYWLRYMDPRNTKALVDKRREKYWAPVDLYVGGAEHATRHLIYGRFWHKFLHDIGVVSTPEPFTRLISVGLILAEDGKKMSKRYGNVINPDDIVRTYGADTLRIYEMFMGPFTDAIAWKTAALIGARRFLERIWRLQEKFVKKADDSVERELHKTIKKVGDDIAHFKFNTAISQMMIFVNAAEERGITKAQYLKFVTLLAPFAPHIADELWHLDGARSSVHVAKWPKFDAKKLVSKTMTIVVQVNGKVRTQVVFAADADEQTIKEEAAKAAEKWLYGKDIRKSIYIPGKLVSLVV